MPGFLMHAGAVIQCPHGAPAQLTPTQPRVLVEGKPVALMSDLILATGCPFMAGPKPQPCGLARWLMPTTRVMINGSPAMVLPSPGAGPGLFQSVDQIPAGPPLVTVVQARVIAT